MPLKAFDGVQNTHHMMPYQRDFVSKTFVWYDLLCTVAIHVGSCDILVGYRNLRPKGGVKGTGLE